MNSKTFNLRSTTMKVVIFAIISICSGVIIARAAWTGPTAEPPGNNVPQPLNIDTVFNGDISGTYNNLRLRISTCSGENEFLTWDGRAFICRNVSSTMQMISNYYSGGGGGGGGTTNIFNAETPSLVEVLNKGADATAYASGISIGDMANSASGVWFDFGGPFKAQWVHAVNPVGTSTFAADLSVAGTASAKEICLNGDCRSAWLSVFVGATKSGYNGNNNGQAGYIAANAECNTDYSGSHVCTTEEIFNTIRLGDPTRMPTDIVWIFNGPPGYTVMANDCAGRTSVDGSNPDYGAIWIISSEAYPDGVGALTSCNNTYKLACCK